MSTMNRRGFLATLAGAVGMAALKPAAKAATPPPPVPPAKTVNAYDDADFAYTLSKAVDERVREVLQRETRQGGYLAVKPKNHPGKADTP